MKLPDETVETGRFFARVAEPAVFAEMFDVLPDVFLFIKDRRHRYVKANRSELALHGCETNADMIGRTDFDFHPPALAAQYVEEDRRVMESGRALVDQIWLVQSADGTPRWYVSSKFPLKGRGGNVIGVAGVMRPFDRTGNAPGDYQRLTRACEYVLAHYGDPIAVEDIAGRAHLSASQLQREFRRLFGMSLGEYLLRVRLIMARRKLEATAGAVGQIALECGFYDQSHFTRAFRAATGLSPLAYRRRFAHGA
jgi:AraC-like DNA-binding protein